ncbi:MAG TPA: PPOX class F420-dependent oxidoreductase [Candidatus Sulfotelmatobacter sp.]|jgi:PPOX class probable F420-dependent enzyme|nr:PPOX class F420-dependent oxidoreductase [Candidatus Sulfotelmatobacter sp.]
MKLSEQAKQMIDRPNFAHLATLMADGSPHVAPVWINREGDRVVISTNSESVKGKNTKQNPRVAVSIVDFNNPYEELQLRGLVIERRPDPDLKALDATSRKYTGQPFPMRDQKTQVALVIDVEKEHYLKLPFAHTPPK